MSGFSGTRDDSIEWRHLSQSLRNRFLRNGISVTGTDSQSSASSSLSPYRVVQRTLYLYSGGSVTKTLSATMMEITYDSGVTYVAEFGWVSNTGDAPAPMQIWLRKAQYTWGAVGTEKGNVEVVGLDTAGTPGYLFVSIAQIPSGTAQTDAHATPAFLKWNDKYGEFDVVRIPSHTANGDRVNAAARMICHRSNSPGAPPTGGTLSIQWIDVAGALVTPIGTVGQASASNFLTDTYPLGTIPEIDTLTGIAAGSLPGLSIADVTGATTITMTLPARYTWSHSTKILAQYVGGGLNPGPVQFTITNPIDQNGAGNISIFQLGSIDFRQLAAHVVIPNTLPGGGGTTNYAVTWDNLNCVSRDAMLENNDYVLIDVLAWIAPAGDDLTTF